MRPSDYRPHPTLARRKVAQQSVLVAMDAETGELLEASSLPGLPEDEFSRLRRAAMADRNARRKGGQEVARFTCLLCREALYLSRHVRRDGNRWFVHERAIPTCAWSIGNRLSPEQHRALIYRGQQEGREHQRIKAFLAQWLERDPAVCDVRQECVTFGQVLEGEWKRPDVICEFHGKRLVFEIQLSYTFLSEIIKRDAFYRAEGIFIIWVFRELDLRRSYVLDEAFFNRRNVFILDEVAVQRTQETGRLCFTGCFQRPVIEGEAIIDAWEYVPISLEQVHFPSDTGRPFFFDYEEKRRSLEIELGRRRADSRWERLRSRVLSTAVDYYDGDYVPALREPFCEAVRELEESPHWHRGLAPLKDPEFSGWHGILPVLLSIRYGRPIGYRLSSVYQVVEASLRQTAKDGRHAYAILYLWACKAFRPAMTTKHQAWVRQRSHHILQSIQGDETTYSRSTAYDEVIAMLFPEMEELLSDFGVHKAVAGVPRRPLAPS